MDWIRHGIDIVLHIDKYLGSIINDYGTWTYALLFMVIFCETGLVATPFLPGDSLLFAAGSFAALGVLDVHLLVIIISIAAIIGDTVNYWLGHYIGAKIFKDNARILKKEYLDRTHRFYEKHGGKTIILARFVPIIRTFAPFVAGIGSMSYGRFFIYNIIGGVLWSALFVYAGYFFGRLPVVQNNFSLVMIAIILISVIPIVIEFLKKKRVA